jgi:hypothetical protein
MRYVTKFDVGDAISTTIKAWAKLFFPLTVFGLLAALPVVAVVYFFPLGDPEQDDGETVSQRLILLGAVAGLVGTAAGLMVSGAATNMVFRHLNQEPVSAGGALADGLAKLPRLLGLSLLVFGGALVLALPAGLLALAGPVGILGTIVLGLVIFVVFLGLVLASPALVVENLGPTDAIRRSLFLAKGRRFGIFVVLFVVGFVAGVLSYVVKLFLPDADLNTIPANASLARIVAETRTAMLLETLVTAPISMLAAVAYVVMYYDLRVEKDGVASEDLAKVFG